MRLEPALVHATVSKQGLDPAYRNCAILTVDSTDQQSDSRNPCKWDLAPGHAGGVKPPDWPYGVHILGHVINHDLNSARFLWKRIPTNIKQSNQELAAVWAIVQKMWLRNRAQCHEAIRGFPWSPILQPVIAAVAEDYRESMYKLLCTAYSTISLADAAAFLGLPECDTVNLMVSRGCSIDPATKMLTVRARPTVTDQKTNMGHLQKLTEYVFHLEH
ncbi:hypothetical protein CBR_g26281 [Chara braunii]|uniref:CSN8/PSMD8/EIF3K domain-containing protein n=1 Tax=Chara braunii TaxID=69332 RepID=A0A388L7J3_CHABU|nr:hypothetical protein CBR_g26281 [Chara braunii]|eukprot:GBG78248.1 hypothetical protein CBR_g26281 [Chara braunii]